MIGVSFRMFIRQITSDSMLVMCCVAPVLAGLLFHFGIPAADMLISQYFGHTVLKNWYLLFDLFLAVLTPFLICFASAMVMLEERDEGVATYVLVTPLGKNGYLVSRLLVPAVIASVVSLGILIIFRLSTLSFLQMIFLSFAIIPIALCVALIITSFSGNRIEGMAMGKLSGLILVGVVIPFFVTSSFRFFAAFLPTFWLAEALLSPGVISVTAFCLISLLWLYVLWYLNGDRVLSGPVAGTTST